MKPASGIAAVFGLVATVPALAGEGKIHGLDVTYTETSRTESKTYLNDARTEWRDHALVRGDITTVHSKTGRTCVSKNGYIMLDLDKKNGAETLTGVVEMNPACSFPKK